MRRPTLLALCAAVAATTCHALTTSEFRRLWTVESEDAAYAVSLLGGDTVEVVAPRGMTIWRNEKLSGSVEVEYDACLMVDPDNVPSADDRPGTRRDRPSDLNCFWMASDPQHPADIMARRRWRSGVFVRCYTMQLYYMGYGGNGNTTTRFRRYDGDARGVTDAAHRPPVLVEYTDASHLNEPNRWRHVRVTSTPQGHVEYWIDGERLVDFRDPNPLREGWFGLRTTWSRMRFANVRITSLPSPTVDDGLTLQWVGDSATPAADRPALAATTFGVPFDPGEVHPTDAFSLAGRDVDFRPLATWPDGSVKWGGFAGSIAAADTPVLRRSGKARSTRAGKKGSDSTPTCTVDERAGQLVVDNGAARFYFPTAGRGAAFVDSITVDGVATCTGAELVATLGGDAIAAVDSVGLLRAGRRQVVVRATGHLAGATSPSFIVHIYITAGVPQARLVHTFVHNIGREHSPAFGLTADDPMLTSLGVRFHVPLRDEPYNRHVAFGDWHEPVQPLHGRRVLAGGLGIYRSQMEGQRIAPVDSFGDKDRALIADWATWDGFRLSQPNDMGYTIRKRAKSATATPSHTLAATPWIGTHAGQRADGTAYVGDQTAGLAVAMRDFWQAYPSTLQVDGATTTDATLTAYMWSPEAEPMDLRHYDTEPHGLNASYEDVQEGMSSAYGMARTSELLVALVRPDGHAADFAATLRSLRAALQAQLLPSPDYLHSRRAFGVWSLPDTSTAERREVEAELTRWADFMAGEQERRHWYGYWNYGDVMHNYDGVRQEWNYDVGGFAWDNTELASNMMLWYNFLRTGRADLWQMAVAMTRHTSEVDVYHTGPWAGLGSRHNVTHWGCGAKESRISSAIWGRFYYYLSGGDDRTGELMDAVVDADMLLYHLDPMRLAQPRELYPCTAPARLRIGPDWLGYVAGWMTRWERTGDVRYRDKIRRGMESIGRMPHGIFTGPKALGYDPATGEISWEGDTSVVNTNHLLPIMGGFEMMNELLPLTPGFEPTWLDFCRRYRQMADSVSHNTFPIPRLAAYAAWRDADSTRRDAAWRELWGYRQTDGRFSTNGIATWALDAIYMLEVCPR